MIGVRRALSCIVVVAAMLGPAAGYAAAKPKPPTKAQVRAAVSRAERSKDLWATVNICTARHAGGGTLGVRGEMPALGFSSRLAMTIQLNAWSTKHKVFVAETGSTARKTLQLGATTTGLQQSGAVFPFTANPGLLNATMTFTWTRSGKVIGQVRRTTSAGHHDADFGKPAHYSAAQCRIG